MTHSSHTPDDRLDEIEENARMLSTGLGLDAGTLETIAALRAVLDLHAPTRRRFGSNCVECSNPYDSLPEEWPCPTVRAIRAALGEARP